MEVVVEALMERALALLEAQRPEEAVVQASRAVSLAAEKRIDWLLWRARAAWARALHDAGRGAP
jgi:hypothetical protein